MAKKALRQGLRVSIKELRDLADELVKEAKERNAAIGLKDPKILERGWIIFIINKQPQCSDTWEIESITEKLGKEEVFKALKKIRSAKYKPSIGLINKVVEEVRAEKKGKRK